MEKYKEKLEKEKELIEKELSDIGVFDKKTSDWDAVPEKQDSPESDENDLADRAEDYEERTAVLSQLEERLNDIKKALEKIEKGEFGVCVVCNKKIEKDRLEANPAALTCKSCI